MERTDIQIRIELPEIKREAHESRHKKLEIPWNIGTIIIIIIRITFRDFRNIVLPIKIFSIDSVFSFVHWYLLLNELNGVFVGHHENYECSMKIIAVLWRHLYYVIDKALSWNEIAFYFKCKLLQDMRNADSSIRVCIIY